MSHCRRINPPPAQPRLSVRLNHFLQQKLLKVPTRNFLSPGGFGGREYVGGEAACTENICSISEFFLEFAEFATIRLLACRVSKENEESVFEKSEGATGELPLSLYSLRSLRAGFIGWQFLLSH